jgi:uncharacterized protein YkwD
MPVRILIVILAQSLSAAAYGQIDVAGVANSVRHAGCAGHSGVRSALTSKSEVAAVAQTLSKGMRLKDAIEQQNYRAADSASLHIEGAESAESLRNILIDNFCAQLTNAELHDVGVAARGSEIWLVLATPLTVADPGKPKLIQSRVLDLTNKARAVTRRCGTQSFGPASPLKLSAELSDAALAHSKDMAAHDELRHEGADGSSPATRVGATGYRWATVGENVAAGPPTADDVVNGWLGSPGHCANIMNPRFTEMGEAWIKRVDSSYGIYWTQVFAAPR